MNTEIINPFLKATKQVVEMMAQIEVVAETPSIKKDNKTWGVVSGLVGLAGEQLSGNMVLSFDEPSIVAIVNAMIGESFSSLNEQVTDAVGELTNMVGGNIKTELFQKAPLFDISVPSVYIGDDLQRRTVSDDLCFHVPFTVGEEAFSVEFLMVTKKHGGTGVQSSLVDGMQKA